MHAEAVRGDATPSKEGRFRDESHPVKCSECDVNYVLHYDNETEVSLTFCGILAAEIVAARHPNHTGNVVLDLVALDRAQQRKTRVVWAPRTSLSSCSRKSLTFARTAAASRAALEWRKFIFVMLFFVSNELLFQKTPSQIPAADTKCDGQTKH